MYRACQYTATLDLYVKKAVLIQIEHEISFGTLHADRKGPCLHQRQEQAEARLHKHCCRHNSSKKALLQASAICNQYI